MTVETAEIARDILAKIKRLQDIESALDEADNVAIKAYIHGSCNMTLDCRKDKFGEPNRYLKYLMDGIEEEIEDLQKQLSRL